MTLKKSKVKPYFKIRENVLGTENAEGICLFYNSDSKDNNNQNLSIKVELQNLGEKEARNIFIETAPTKEFEFIQNKDERYIAPVIESNEKFIFLMTFIWNKDYLFKLNKEKYVIKNVFTLLFSDCYENMYIQHYYLKVEIKIDIKNKKIYISNVVIKPCDSSILIDKAELNRLDKFYDRANKNIINKS